MTNIPPGVSVFTEPLPERQNPVALGFTKDTKPTQEQESLIYLAEQSRARAKAASVPSNT